MVMGNSVRSEDFSPHLKDYTPDCKLPEIRAAGALAKTVFESPWTLDNREKFSEATQLFEDCVRLNSADGVAAIYLHRCRQQL